MALAKQICVKESVSDLKKVLNGRSVTIVNRVRMLILLKNNPDERFSKTKLGELLGVSSGSIQIWRRMYEKA